MKIEVYSDGSGTSKLTPGGYGWVLVVDGVKHSEGNGYMPQATNNDAELEGAIQGLVAAFKFLNSGPLFPGDDGKMPIKAKVTLVSDSQIILGWASGAHRFKQESKMQKFIQLNGLVMKMDVNTRWVEGHSGDEHNERCDKLANMGRLQKTEEELASKKRIPKTQNRLFRWNEALPGCEPNTPKEIITSGNINPNIHLVALTRVVIELMELEEARKK